MESEEPLTPSSDKLDQARSRMVESQIISRGIANPLVLEAMRAVPRHLFVPPERRRHAHGDNALPIGYGQTISQPYMVALMTELALVGPMGWRGGDESPTFTRVLEVGGGSGYHAAVLAQIADNVVTVERVPELAQRARKTLETLGYDNVEVLEQDGSTGIAEKAPFDGIVVAAAAPAVPEALQDQLAPGAHLVIPVGNRGMQELQVITRTESGWRNEGGPTCVFVPLIGEDGWPPSP